jgi:signal transduction histidine kinase
VEAISAAMAKVVEGNLPVDGLELRFCRSSGECFDVSMLVTALRDSFDNVSGWLSSITDITQRKKAEAELRRSHEELEHRVQERTADLSTANSRLKSEIAERRRLEHELLDITEKERRRIGLDLHDDLGQKLAGIALMAKGLQLRLAKQRAGESDDAGKIHELLEQAMSHARDLARDLATLDFSENDLPSAIEKLASHVKDSFGITCRFKSDEAIPPLETNTVKQLYKITQEALTNAIKHGKAKQVSIQLSNGSNRLALTIRNSGAPFPSVVGRNAGMGLRIMNYRANLIGASLEIKPGDPEGTVVTCLVPIKK